MKMTARAQRKRRSRAAILDSAARLLRQKGIRGARVADVMAGAGLTAGGFYAHFPSKRALVDETVRRTASDLRDALFAPPGSGPEGERIDAVLGRYLATRHRDARGAGCPFPAIVGDVATHAPQHRAVLAEQMRALADRLERHLPRARSRRLHAIGLVALMYGGLSMSLALRGTPLADDVLRASRLVGGNAVRGVGRAKSKGDRTS